MGFHKGYVIGPIWLPKDIAKLAHATGWRDKDLIVAVAVSLAESAGGVNSYNINYEDHGLTKILSKDCGLWQINIPADKIGSKEEKNIFIPENNAKAAFALYKERQWEPWNAYTSGVALGPSWAGKYIQKAVRGTANFWAEEFKLQPDPFLDFRGGWRNFFKK